MKTEVLRGTRKNLALSRSSYGSVSSMSSICREPWKKKTMSTILLTPSGLSLIENIFWAFSSALKSLRKYCSRPKDVRSSENSFKFSAEDSFGQGTYSNFLETSDYYLFIMLLSKGETGSSSPKLNSESLLATFEILKREFV